MPLKALQRSLLEKQNKIKPNKKTGVDAEVVTVLVKLDGNLSF